MTTKSAWSPHSQFSRALSNVRKARGLSQEEFDLISSRTYISALERGLKQPTLPKVDALSEVLGVHPLTVLVLSYVAVPTGQGVQSLLNQVLHEVYALELTGF